MTGRDLPTWQQSRPERWWCWLLLAFSIWAAQWASAAGDPPQVVDVTIGRVLASLFAQVVLIGASVFRAGVLYGELRRRQGEQVSFVRPE